MLEPEPLGRRAVISLRRLICWAVVACVAACGDNKPIARAGSGGQDHQGGVGRVGGAGGGPGRAGARGGAGGREEGHGKQGGQSVVSHGFRDAATALTVSCRRMGSNHRPQNGPSRPTERK